MKSAEYWAGRFKDLEKAAHDYGLATYAKIEKAFTRAQQDIQKEIDSWCMRFAKNNKITMQEARRLLNSSELKEFKWDIEDYIKYGKENALDGKWMKQLENASAKYHVSRLEALQLRTQQAMEVAFGGELDEVDALARKLYTDGYYHGMFEVQKGFNIGWSVGQIDTNTLYKVIAKPWAADGKNFSDRIWDRKSEMVNSLHNELTRMLILGKAPDEAIKNMTRFVSGKVKNAKNAAATLVMTEDSYFHSVSQKKVYADLEVEEYEIVATLDLKTSEICRDLDGKHLPLKDFAAGSTAPPFHPRCRSVTAPYFDDDFAVGERAARDGDGKTYYVPGDMSYKEWKRKFVDVRRLSKQLEFEDSTYKSFIPQNSLITHVKAIAGNGTSEEFRNAEQLSNVYGGNSGDWLKMVGKITSDKYIFDIHWCELHGKIYEEKIKTIRSLEK